MATTSSFEFEKALKELEGITAWFESSDVDLDAGLVKFERGMELAHQLKTHLASVENRVEKIKQRFSAASNSDTTPSDQPEAGLDHAPDADQANLFRG